jgi:superfamily II helicase
VKYISRFAKKSVAKFKLTNCRKSKVHKAHNFTQRYHDLNLIFHRNDEFKIDICKYCLFAILIAVFSSRHSSSQKNQLNSMRICSENEIIASIKYREHSQERTSGVNSKLEISNSLESSCNSN